MHLVCFCCVEVTQLHAGGVIIMVSGNLLNTNVDGKYRQELGELKHEDPQDLNQHTCFGMYK